MAQKATLSDMNQNFDVSGQGFDKTEVFSSLIMPCLILDATLQGGAKRD
jgi:hypothetical protein